MITLQRADSKVSAFLGENKGIKQGDYVHPSVYALALKLGARNVILNTLTGQCVESKYHSWFESREERFYDENDREMVALCRRDFLISSKINESERYYRMLPVIRAMEKSKIGYTGYTILPTTACNARCSYCFEAGIKYETMTDEVVEQTIRYINITRRKDTPIDLRWFGGEPLIGESIIDRICESMRKIGVKYRSSMISNGSLVTEELAEKAKSTWNLESIQITLDGREEEYLLRKCYQSFNGSPYRAVLKGIHALLDQRIRVNIRLNVDEDNIEELMMLIDELEDEFATDSRVRIYCHSIYSDDETTERDNTLLYEGMNSLNERLNIFNQNRRSNLRANNDINQSMNDNSVLELENDDEKEENYYDRCGHMKRYFCMVDSPGAGGVILPNGDIRLCEHIGELTVVGTIFDEAPIEREDFIEREREKIKKCDSCPFLPKCTDYTGCPTKNRDCQKEEMISEISALRDLEDEKKLPPIKVSVEDKVIKIIEPDSDFAELCTPYLTWDYLEADETLTQEEAMAKYAVLTASGSVLQSSL